MKTLTVHQPFASLIVHGFKPVEWRGWPMPGKYVGQVVVIHASVLDPMKGIRHLMTDRGAIELSCGPAADVAGIREALDRMADHRHAIPTGCGIGTVRFGKPRQADVIYHRKGLKIGAEGPWNYGWPVFHATAWDEPVEARGYQGFWPWPYPVNPLALPALLC